MSKIHFVGGEKGGVGKSVVSRLLTQFCIDRAVPFAAVDADSSHRTLTRYYGDYARPVDLSRLESVDEVMGLATDAERRVVVDLPAQSDRAVSAWIAEAGIFDLAREAGVQIAFWHVMDDGKDSLVALERLLERHGAAARYFLVKNRGRGKDFALFDSSPTKERALALGALVVELPELQESAMRKIDRFDASYWAAVHNEMLGGDTFTRLDRQRIKVWLQSSFDQIARLGESF
ncbi:MAG: mobilization protein [Myxococcota bacterium]|nr:mobilization protein [Myxococcota bacterium]